MSEGWLNGNGLTSFLAAGARLAKSAPDIPLTFIVVGHDEGRMVPDLRDLAKSMGIEDKVQIVGFRHPIEAWIAGMDLLMATSEREPFGRTLIEAMAVGTPVVASATAGHLEIIDDERTGLLVPPNDADAFASAAYRILTEPALAAKLVKNGRACAATRYAVETHVNRVCTIYDSLL